MPRTHHRSITVRPHADVKRAQTMHNLLAAVFLSLFGYCAALQAQSPVTITELLNDQAQYDGRTVQVCGILSLKFERTELTAKGGSIWLDLTGKSMEERQKRFGGLSALNGKCVQVDGTFKKGGAHGAGHFNQWPAAIGSISSIRGVSPETCR